MTPEQIKEQIANDARLAAQKVYGGSYHTCASEQFKAFEDGYKLAAELYNESAKDAWERAMRVSYDLTEQDYLLEIPYQPKPIS